MQKCNDCKRELESLYHCSHCNNWVCAECGWLRHKWFFWHQADENNSPMTGKEFLEKMDMVIAYNESYRSIISLESTK